MGLLINLIKKYPGSLALLVISLVIMLIIILIDHIKTKKKYGEQIKS